MRQRCTSEEFKENLDDLCDDCPIKLDIEKYIDIQIRKQASEKKELLPEEAFLSYLTQILWTESP